MVGLQVRERKGSDQYVVDSEKNHGIVAGRELKRNSNP